jgi:hypothetical protein
MATVTSTGQLIAAGLLRAGDRFRMPVVGAGRVAAVADMITHTPVPGGGVHKLTWHAVTGAAGGCVTFRLQDLVTRLYANKAVA